MIWWIGFTEGSQAFTAGEKPEENVTGLLSEGSQLEDRLQKKLKVNSKPAFVSQNLGA
jgi:hypothetical protein